MTISRGRFTLRGAICCFAASALVAALHVGIGPGARAASNLDETHLVYPNTWFAYVQAGEELTWSFEKTRDGADTHTVPITVEGPGVAPWADEFVQADPPGTVIADSVVAPESGIYRITLVTTAGIVQEHFPGLFLDRGWYEWEITVHDGAEIPGRVWADQYTVAQQLPPPAQGGGYFDITYWFQSMFGILYQVDYSGYNGIHSIFYADPVGIVEDGTCNAAYRSIFFNDAGFEPAEGGCGDGAFKLFFEEPDPGLPAEATTWDGGTEWINPPLPPAPEIHGLTFTSDAPGINSGDLTFGVTNFPAGAVTVKVDTDGDGSFDGPGDCTIEPAVVEGEVDTHFEGFTCGANPQPIPPTQEIGFQVVIDRMAEIHFVNYDVEARVGIEVTQVNGPNPGTKAISWDDSHLGPDGDHALLTPPAGRETLPTDNFFTWFIDTWPGWFLPGDVKCEAAAFIGDDVDSSGGVHGWAWSGHGAPPLGGENAEGGAGLAIGWGNNRYIDDWTFAEIGEVQQTLVVDGRASTFAISKSSDPESGTAVEPGDIVTYELAITNLDIPDAVTLTDVSVEDDLSGVLDDAVLIAGPDATEGSVVLDGDTIRWQGTLPPGARVLVTYSVTVSEEEALGDLLLVNVATTASEFATNCPPEDPGPECSTEHPVTLVGPGAAPPDDDDVEVLAHVDAFEEAELDGAMPFTGATLGLVLLVALMMLGLGTTLYEATRRRRPWGV